MLVVIDGEPYTPVTSARARIGIVASKNASLTALMDAGCEHLFYGKLNNIAVLYRDGKHIA